MPPPILFVAPAFAESPAAPPPPLDKKAADIDAQRLNYQGVQDTLAQAEEQRKKIEAEIASFQNDRAALAKALIDARQKIEDSENKVAETQNRLETLTGSEAAIRRSLDSRRGVLVEVLGRPAAHGAQAAAGLAGPAGRCFARDPRLDDARARCCRNCARKPRPWPTILQDLVSAAGLHRRGARRVSPANWRRGATSGRGSRR